LCYHVNNWIGILDPVFFLFKIENLVLWARSEMIGSAIGQICSWFQVSGVSVQVSAIMSVISEALTLKYGGLHKSAFSDTLTFSLTPDT